MFCIQPMLFIRKTIRGSGDHRKAEHYYGIGLKLSIQTYSSRMTHLYRLRLATIERHRTNLVACATQLLLTDIMEQSYEVVNVVLLLN